MTANVLRLRREWDRAETTCSEVLRHHPQSAAAHSLMGDIFRDRGRRRDAIECYKLALDLNPASIADRRKLEELIDQEFPARRQGLISRAGAAISRGLGSAAAEAGLASRASALVLLVGFALAAILVIAVTMAILGRGVTPPPPVEHEQSGGFLQVPGGGAAPGASRAQQASAQPQVAEELAGQVVAMEEASLARLRQRAAEVNVMAEVVSASVDPREASLVVHLVMPRPWVLTGLRQNIQRLAEEVAIGAAVDSRIQLIKLRCDMRQQGRPDEMAMWAEVSGARAGAGREALKPGEGLFPLVWWHPELRPPVAGVSAASE
jgi:tetratricopeptide (TPR) repeat protein